MDARRKLIALHPFSWASLRGVVTYGDKQYFLSLYYIVIIKISICRQFDEQLQLAAAAGHAKGRCGREKKKAKGKDPRARFMKICTIVRLSGVSSGLPPSCCRGKPLGGGAAAPADFRKNRARSVFRMQTGAFCGKGREDRRTLMRESVSDPYAMRPAGVSNHKGTKDEGSAGNGKFAGERRRT
jgi:hypothetical protein